MHEPVEADLAGQHGLESLGTQVIPLLGARAALYRIKDRRPEQPKSPDPITIEHNGADQFYDRSFVVAMDPEGKPLQTFRVSVRPEDRPRTGHLSHLEDPDGVLPRIEAFLRAAGL